MSDVRTRDRAVRAHHTGACGERAQPRAPRADPGVAAGHRGLRRRVHPALERALERVADLRRDVPRAVHRRARVHPDHAAARRPVHVPAGGGAGQLRAGDGLPDQPDAGAPAGTVVRARADPVRGDDPRVPRLPQARALPLHDRVRSRSGCSCSRACRASATPPTARTSACGSRACSCSSRPSSPRSAWSSSWPATCATRGRCSCRAGGGSSGITLPPIKQFGPVVVIWGLAMATLVVLSDTGSSVMFYGGLLAMLYVATNRLSFVVDRPDRRGDRLLVPGHAHPPHPRSGGDVAASARTRGCTTHRSAATRSPTRCSPRPPAGCSARASAGRR